MMHQPVCVSVCLTVSPVVGEEELRADFISETKSRLHCRKCTAVCVVASKVMMGVTVLVPRYFSRNLFSHGVIVDSLWCAFAVKYTA